MIIQFIHFALLFAGTLKYINLYFDQIQVPSKPVRAANTLDGLLSDLTSEENLIEIFKTDAWNDDIYCPRILKSPYGALADEFQKYLSSREEKETLKVEAIRKFSFLILIEIVLQCKDRTKQAPVFDHLVSLFLNNKSDNYIELKNDLIADELSSLEIREDAQHSNAIKYLRMAKSDATVWEGGKGCLVPIYNVEFRSSPEFKTFSEKNVFVACLLSIL